MAKGGSSFAVHDDLKDTFKGRIYHHQPRGGRVTCELKHAQQPTRDYLGQCRL
ncbi:MAG: hypothetical protein ACI81A_001226, partial [Paraglaciecola sp.]